MKMNYVPRDSNPRELLGSMKHVGTNIQDCGFGVHETLHSFQTT
jgi:hypothetical protein